MRNVVVALLLLFVISCSAKVSKAEFTSKFVEELSKNYPSETTSLGIKYKDTISGLEGSIFLDNAYKQYMDGASIADLIRKYLDSFSEVTQQQHYSAKDIVPVVKDSGYIEEVAASIQKRLGKDRQFPFYHEQFADGLEILYGYDTPQNIHFLSEDDVAQLHMKKSELKAMALSNLESRLPEIHTVESNGILLVKADGNYESSVLLFDDFWKRLESRVSGKMIVAVPSRDSVMVVGSLDSAGISNLRRRVKEVLEADPYRLTDQLYIREGKGWSPYNG